MSETNVIGYFNGNTYPIQINISSLGMSYTLAAGEYITATDDKGAKVKINDPIFEGYLGKARLSKEVLKDRKVNIYRVISRDARGQVPSFQGLPISKDTEGKTVLPVVPATTSTGGPNLPYRAMSMEDAYKNGVIRRPRVTESKGLVETEGAPYQGQVIPEITYDDADTRQAPKLNKNLTMDSVKLNLNEAKAELAPAPTQTVQPVTVPNIEVPTLEDLSADGTSKFVCDLDMPPTTFDYRSQLESYLRKNYPNNMDYMLRYPKARKKT